MTYYNIPLTNDPFYSFTTTLDNNVYRITIKWNEAALKWFFNLQGLTTEQSININGICLLPGIDLLSPFGIRELGMMKLFDIQDKKQEPDFDSFGDRFQLYYISLGD